MGNEKGIRCNTGAVPAAVSPLMVSDSNTTVPVNGMGRFRKPDEPEDLPKIHYNFFAFGNNSKSELQFIVSHFLPILQEAGKLT
jgi:hypothetical protein